MTRNFKELLEAKWAEGKFVCVGLDTDWEELPPSAIKSSAAESMVEFNAQIIDATKDVVAAYKPNIAFYEDRGTPGLVALETTMEHLREVAPDVPVILDNKRGDIGKSNKGYVRFAFEELSADACTIHPYMGMEAMRPFLDRGNKGIFVLCKTSNPGSSEFQDLEVSVSPYLQRKIGGKMRLFEYVAHRASHEWNYKQNVGIVVGATYPEAFERIRKVAEDLPILCPGVGAQGGDVKRTVQAARDSRGKGFLINSSSGIIFASKGPDCAEAARRETLKLHNKITAEHLTSA